ncbi:MAG: hypothetical protein JNM92_15085 [Zoogloea sp.]|nr:hypothetical protein [Zoogloea sp.]
MQPPLEQHLGLLEKNRTIDRRRSGGFNRHTSRPISLLGSDRSAMESQIQRSNE